MPAAVFVRLCFCQLSFSFSLRPSGCHGVGSPRSPRGCHGIGSPRIRSEKTDTCCCCLLVQKLFKLLIITQDVVVFASGLCCFLCVFITAVPITNLFAWRKGDSGGHVLRETTSQGMCGLVYPSHTSERGGNRDCVQEGGGEEGERKGSPGASTMLQPSTNGSGSQHSVCKIPCSRQAQCTSRRHFAPFTFSNS